MHCSALGMRLSSHGKALHHRLIQKAAKIASFALWIHAAKARVKAGLSTFFSAKLCAWPFPLRA